MTSMNLVLRLRAPALGPFLHCDRPLMVYQLIPASSGPKERGVFPLVGRRNPPHSKWDWGVIWARKCRGLYLGVHPPSCSTESSSSPSLPSLLPSPSSLTLSSPFSEAFHLHATAIGALFPPRGSFSFSPAAAYPPEGPDDPACRNLWVLIGVNLAEGEGSPWRLPPYSMKAAWSDGSTRVTFAR